MVKQVISLSLFVCSTLIHAMDKEKALQPLAPHRATQFMLAYVSHLPLSQAAKTLEQKFPKTIARINHELLSYEGACLIMCQLPTDIQGTILENEFNLSIPARNKFLSMAPTGAFEHYAACAHENDQVLRNNFSLATRFLLSTEQTTLMRRMIFNEINGNGEAKYVTFEKQPATALHCTFLNTHEKKLLTALPQEFIDDDNQNPIQHVLEKLMICEHPSMMGKIVKTPLSAFLYQMHLFPEIYGNPNNVKTICKGLFLNHHGLIVGVKALLHRLAYYHSYPYQYEPRGLFSTFPAAATCFLGRAICTRTSLFNDPDGYIVPYHAISFVRADSAIVLSYVAIDFAWDYLAKIDFKKTLIDLSLITIPALCMTCANIYNGKARYEINPISVKQLWDAEQERIKKQQSRLCTLL